MTLDVIELPKSHSGVNLAKAFAEVVTSFGIEEKVCSYVRASCCGLYSP